MQNSSSQTDMINGTASASYSNCDYGTVEMTTEQEMFLYELETFESDRMENLILAIYDTVNIQQFVSALQSRISQYDRNTQKVCYLHHESIVEALQELIQLKEYSQGIRCKTQWKDSEILRISHRLCHRKWVIVKFRMPSSSSTSQQANMASETASTSNGDGVEISAEQEYLLYELETAGTENMEMVIRAIYKSGNVNLFARALQHRINERKIQKICSFQYQNFVNAMQELIEFEEQCQNVDDDTMFIDEEIQRISQRLCREKQEKEQNRLVLSIPMARVYYYPCSKAMHTVKSALQFLISDKDYYHAMIFLKGLERIHSANIEGIWFKTIITPGRLEIKEKAYSEIKDFLENIEKMARRIGNHAVNNGKMATQDLIDFTSFHKCCQIFSLLGAKDEIEQYYRQKRLEQCDSVVESFHNLNIIEKNVEYFEEIVGFFVVEDQILNTECNLSNNEDKDNLWDRALQKMYQHLKTELVSFRCDFFSTTILKFRAHSLGYQGIWAILEMKKHILRLIRTMESHSYDVASFCTLLQDFWKYFNDVQLEFYSAVFKGDLDNQDFGPLTVESEKAYQDVIKEYPVFEKSTEQDPLPHTFPFSRFVLTEFTQAKQYIVDSFEFMDAIKLNEIVVGDNLSSCLSQLLDKSAEILEKFDITQISMAQLAQLSIVVYYLEMNYEYLDKFINSLTKRKAVVSMYRINPEMAFMDFKSKITHQCNEMMRAKIDDFLGTYHFDWELPDASDRASNYIIRLLNLLAESFKNFKDVSTDLTKRVFTTAFEHIAYFLMEILMSPDILCISPGALEQFKLDVAECEYFASLCRVEGVNSEIFVMEFMELKHIPPRPNNFVGFTDGYWQRAECANIIKQKLADYETKRNNEV
uniref:Sec15 domain-containing protein n=1 Tax=Caenorhabditis tropicalis TaxID=1561998 RepID=A0A1I7TR36_9PELO